MAIPAAYAGSFYGGYGQTPGRGNTGMSEDDLWAEEQRKRVRELTEGRAATLANDPYQKSVMDFLQGVTQGNNVPFTNEVQGAMLAQQGRGSADAEAAQMESLRQSMGASGGSIYDPAYQAAAREAMSQRQGRNLDAQGQMQAMAGRENFNARMAGAGGLAQARNAQNAQINQMSVIGAQSRAKEFRERGGGGGVYTAGGGYAPRPGQTNTTPRFTGVNLIENQAGYRTPGTEVRGGAGIPGVYYGSGTPQQTTAPQQSVVYPYSDVNQTNAERNAAQDPRRMAMRNGTNQPRNY